MYTSQRSNLQNLLVFLSISVTLIITYLIYAPGLHGGFLFDDTINIIDNPKVLIKNLHWQDLERAALSYGNGTRPISMLSLGINHALTDLDPFYFKLTNLVIHLLCGIGIWLLTRLLLFAYRIHYCLKLTDNETEWISVAVTAVWLLHPLNLTSVLYVVQRMASLAALFMVFGLVSYTWGRLRQLRGQHGTILMVAGTLFFGSLAVLSKENGILLPLLIFLIEWLIFGFKAFKNSTRYFVIGFIIVTVIIPGLLAFGLLIIRFDWVLAGYDIRDFTISERLLTQARVIWFYINMILLPDPTQMGLYHDDIVLSKNWFEPSTTLPAILGILTILIGVIAARKRAPLLTFGILFFFAGHTLESTILSLEIAHEHRNYLPSYGLLLVSIYYLGHRKIRERLSPLVQTAFIILLILGLSTSTAIRASYWSNNADLALMEVQHHPLSARTSMQAGYIFFLLAEHGVEPDLNRKRARQYFEKTRYLDRYNLTGSFSLLILDNMEEHPINTALLDEIADRLKNQPLAAANINSLLKFSRCLHYEQCKIPSDVFNQLFKAILQNPTLRGKPRAQVLSEVAQFAISQNDLGIALYLTYQALAINPDDPQIHLNLAHLLIHVEEFEAAHQAIEKARALDHDAFLSTRIQAQEKLLEQAKARLTSNPESHEKNSTP